MDIKSVTSDMKSTPIVEINGKTLVRVEKKLHFKKTEEEKGEEETRIEWVLATGYDDTKPEREKWRSGHYEFSFEDMIRYIFKLDEMYLITMEKDTIDSKPVHAVVKTKEEAYEKIKEFMSINDMELDKDKERDLRLNDYIFVGKYGYINIDKYKFGETIQNTEED